jgi:hypothetical protein
MCIKLGQLPVTEKSLASLKTLTHLKSSSNLLLPGGFSRVGATPVARVPVPSFVNSELFEPNIPFVLMPGNPPFLYFAASAPGAAERRRLPAAVALDIRAPSCKFEELPIPVVERVGGGVRDPCMPMGLGDAVTVPGKQIKDSYFVHTLAE